MALLCHGESAAWRSGRKDQTCIALANERGFLDQHLLAWAPKYLGTLAREAQHGFYRALAQIIRDIVQADRALIDDLAIEVWKEPPVRFLPR